MNKTLSHFEKTIDQIVKLNGFDYALLNEPIHEGKWSIREIVGHLYYWDKFNLEQMIPKMIGGANLPEFPDHDQHNKEAIANLKNKSVETVINDFANTRKELIECLLNLSDNVKFTIGKGKRQFTGESFIKIFLKHDTHHLEQINEKLRSRK